MILTERHKSTTAQSDQTNGREDTADEILLYIVGIMAGYNSGGVTVHTYERKHGFVVDFSSAGHSYTWAVEDTENLEDMRRLFALLCYYSVQQRRSQPRMFWEWCKEVHRDLGLHVAPPSELQRSWSDQLAKALLYAFDIGYELAYFRYKPVQLAEAWCLSRLCDTSFDEVLKAS